MKVPIQLAPAGGSECGYAPLSLHFKDSLLLNGTQSLCFKPNADLAHKDKHNAKRHLVILPWDMVGDALFMH